MKATHNTTVLQDVDFLPARFREEYAQRRMRAWRIFVVAVFASALPVASLYQYRIRLALKQELAAVAQQQQQSLADQQRLATLQSTLAELNSTAELFSWTNHPWPRTQLLAAVAAPMPESITLDQLKIFVEPFETERRPTKRTEQSSGSKQGEPKFPSARDQRTLSGQLDGATLVRIHGRTTNSSELHGYLADLADSEFFMQADLDAIGNQATDAMGRPAADFEALLVVRPSYFQPNGPRGPSRQLHPEQIAKSAGRESP